ncbi:MAG: hypothetical protein AAFY28_13115, partial [Actinomycetota bacterium]
ATALNVGDATTIKLTALTIFDSGTVLASASGEYTVPTAAVSDDATFGNPGNTPTVAAGGNVAPFTVSLATAIALNDDIQTQLDTAVAAIGSTVPGFGIVQAVGLGIIVEDAQGTPGRDTNFNGNTVGGPIMEADATTSTFDAGQPFVFGAFSAGGGGAVDEQNVPQYVDTPTNLTSVVIDDEATPRVAAILDRVFSNGNPGGDTTNDINQFVEASNNEDDIEIGNSTFSTLKSPTISVGPTILTSGNVVTWTFVDDAEKPTSTDSFRFASDDSGAPTGFDDAKDFLGNPLADSPNDTGVGIDPQTLLMPTGARWTASDKSAGGTATLTVDFNVVVTNPGSADTYDVMLEGEALVAGGYATFGAPSIGTDQMSVDIPVDFSANNSEFGVAPNGRALDADPLSDLEGIGGMFPIDVTQSDFFVMVQTDTNTTDPQDALETDLDLDGNPFTDTNPAADEVAPDLIFGATGDTDGDGNVDTIFGVFDERMTNGSVDGETIFAIDGTNVTQLSDIGDDGSLPMAVALDLGGDQEVTVTGTSLTSIDPNLHTDGTPALETQNTIAFALDVAFLGTFVPSSGNTGNFRVEYDGPNGNITDASGNPFLPAGSPFVEVVNTDRAAPAHLGSNFFTGDNQTGGSDAQFAAEQDGTIGDQADNDRASLFFSEDVFGTPDPDFITADGDGFGNGATSSTSDNTVSVVNDDNVIDYGPDSVVSLLGGNGITDGTGNEATSAGVAAVNCVAPYVPLQQGPIDSAFLVDSDNDDNADSVFVQFTVAVTQADLESDGSQFNIVAGAAGATIDAADTTTGTDGPVVVLTLGGTSVPMSSTITIEFDASVADSLSAVATGKAIDDAVTTENQFDAQEISTPGADATQDPAIQFFRGTITDLDGVSPAPLGTRIRAYVAIPTVSGVTWRHNNHTAEYNIASSQFASNSSLFESSLEAWTNFVLGIEDRVYLHRDEDNTQFWSNIKFQSGIIVGDSIECTLTGNNLNNLSFRGTGESSSDRVDQGSFTITWDFARSSGGSLENFYLNGYSFGGSPICSEALVTTADGGFEIAVSAPTADFGNGEGFLDGVDNPIVFVVERVDGSFYAVSGLLSSATTNDHDDDGDIGDNIVFDPSVLRQESDGTRPDFDIVNFNLANVTGETIGSGWNFVPFAGAGGYATATNRIPTLPSGVTTDNVQTDGVDFASPLDQFVWWADTNGNGIWDDGNPNSIVIDANRVNHFAFNLTTGGVKIGEGIDNIVGGYAFAFFNNAGAQLGVQGHGAPLSQDSIFADNPITGGNRNATQGWLLVSVTRDFDTPEDFFGASFNPDADFILLFRGGDVGYVDGFGTPEASNVNEIEANEGAMVHYDN